MLGRRLPKREEKAAPERELPLHVRTIEALERIQSKELWQKGKTKQYYSEITDTLRAYIEERYRIPALERTTFELKRELKLSGMSRDDQESLIQGLELADMVKFAKYRPIGPENVRFLEQAFELVRNTSKGQIHDNHEKG